MKLGGNASCFLDSQHRLWYIFELLVGQAFTQVKAYNTDEGINLADVPALIMVLEMVFRDPDGVAIVERKLKILK
jgi:hypothetical protein